MEGSGPRSVSDPGAPVVGLLLVTPGDQHVCLFVNCPQNACLYTQRSRPLSALCCLFFSQVQGKKVPLNIISGRAKP